MKVSIEEAALWLLVGFKRSWSLWQVVSALGFESPEDDVEAMEIHRKVPFFPIEAWGYRRTPVRAFVAAQFPKLADHLIATEGKSELWADLVPEVCKLKAKGSRGVGFLNRDDAKVMKKTREDLRSVTTANRAARKQQLSTQRGAWKVCK